MIIIQTGELVGLIKDVIGFACAEDGMEAVNTVTLSWDGETLTAEACDPLRGVSARSQWHPDDEEDEDVAGMAPWGGDDDPWSTVISLDDAKHLVKIFGLKAKLRGVPLTVEQPGVDRRLRIRRRPDTGCSEIDHTIRNQDVPAMTLTIFDDPPAPPDGATSLMCGPGAFKALGAVRQRGPVATHTTESGWLIATVGPRFVAAFTKGK